MDNILELKNVTKRFPQFTLDQVSFELPYGYIMGFIGSNGAGKTVTIKSIINLLNKDEGEINIFGLDHNKHEQNIKERIGIVMDQIFFADDWTIAVVEKVVRPFYKNWDSNRFQELLQHFALDKKKKVKDLSKGMKMKLMIAVALSHNAELLILDEPTSGLDPVARDELLEILSDFIADERRGVLMSTHITQDLEKIADYITFIQNGSILFTGPKDQLLETYLLVKGGPEDLTADIRPYLIGLREHSTGFDAMVHYDNLVKINKNLVVETSTLDEIIVRINKEGKKHE